MEGAVIQREVAVAGRDRQFLVAPGQERLAEVRAFDMGQALADDAVRPIRPDDDVVSSGDGAVRRVEPKLAELVIEAGQAMIEPKVDARLRRGRLHELTIEPGARHRIDGPLTVGAVRLERRAALAVVQDPAPHRERLGEDRVREPRPFERIDAADREREVDRPSGFEIGSPRVRATLVERDLVSAPGKEDREEWPSKSGTHDRDPCDRHRLDRSASGGTMAG